MKKTKKQKAVTIAALDRAIQLTPERTQENLAELLRIKSQSINGWRATGKVPLVRGVQIEQLPCVANQVSRDELCPEFPW